MSLASFGRNLLALSQALSSTHSASQAIPSSQQEIAEIARAVSLSEEAFDRFPKTDVHIAQDPRWEHANVLPVHNNSIA